MTLEELVGLKEIIGRVLETREESGFIFRAKIKAAGRWDVGTVCFFLTDVVRRFKTSDSPWRHVEDSQMVLPSRTLVEIGADGSKMFPLPGNGRATIFPRETS